MLRIIICAWEMTECGMKNDGTGEMRQEVDDRLISWLEENPNVELRM